MIQNMIFGNTNISFETITMNLSTDMCRVCMTSSEYLKDVISFELTTEILNMLSTFANIDISTDVCLPSLICNKCFTRLIDAINFRNMCIESNNTYKNYVMKMKNESIEISQGNKEIPPPKSSQNHSEIVKIEEMQRKDNESENIMSHSNAHKEFITVKNITEMIDEPSSELLNALGLIKVTDIDNKQKKIAHSSESMNNSLDNIIQESKDCTILNNVPHISNNNKKCTKKSYKCDVCFSILYDYGVFRRHLAAHGERPFECKICGIRFSKIRALKEHSINTHSGSRPYSCTQCSSNFVTLNELTIHLRKHAGNSEPHMCLTCNKRFCSAKLLREHTTVHDNEKKLFEKHKKSTTGFGEHSCSQCERRFRKRCDLERHERVHSGEKPYSCTICGGRFQQAHNLTKHMVTHTGVRSFTCDICQKTFGRSDVLTRHMHVHEVSKPFNCEHCFRTFARQSQLTSHLVKKHPK